eukprot:scaffold117993_cov34-Tisochrysis_lutea.AAC.2
MRPTGGKGIEGRSEPTYIRKGLQGSSSGGYGRTSIAHTCLKASNALRSAAAQLKAHLLHVDRWPIHVEGHLLGPLLSGSRSNKQLECVRRRWVGPFCLGRHTKRHHNWSMRGEWFQPYCDRHIGPLERRAADPAFRRAANLGALAPKLANWPRVIHA